MNYKQLISPNKSTLALHTNAATVKQTIGIIIGDTLFIISTIKRFLLHNFTST